MRARSRGIALLLGLATWQGHALAGPDLSSPETTPSPSARLRLEAARLEPVQGGSRFALRGRFQRQESAGELRESGAFKLIGRFGKAGASCDFSAVFKNGFEG